MKKHQKEKEQNWKNAKAVADKYLSIGIDRDEYIAQAQKEYPNDWQAYVDSYDEHRKFLPIPAEHLEDMAKLSDLMTSRAGDNLSLYFPIFELLTWEQVGDVALLSIKSKYDFTFTHGKYKKQFTKGLRDYLVVSEILKEGQLVIVDQTTNEVLTKSTEITEKEIIKVKTETKIVKQEVKKGLSQKEIDKALESTRREFKSKFFDESLLNQILESVKNNLK
jgi:hypothetical protein